MRRYLILAPLFACACMADANLATVQQGLISGWGPEVKAYYNETADGSSATTMVIVAPGAMDSNFEARLATYRSGKSLPTCSTANGCLHQFRGDGSTTLPTTTVGSYPTDALVAAEIASAGCGHCKLTIVQPATAGNDDVKQGTITAKGKGQFVLQLPLLADGASQVSDIDTSFTNSGIALVLPVGTGSGSVFGIPVHGIGVAKTALTSAVNSRNATEALNAGRGGFSGTFDRPSWQPNIGSSKNAVTSTAIVGTNADFYDLSGSWTQTSGTTVAAALFVGMIAALEGVLVTPEDISNAPMFSGITGSDDNSNAASGSFNKGDGFGVVDFNTLNP